jgi:catechol 2,3-dioxygenase-like lactoylglutathione lyase family enzyme
MSLITCIDHLNVQVPPEKEAEAKVFYGELLGLRPLKKPDSLGPAGQHYCVSENPYAELHLGVARNAEGQSNKARRRFEAAGVRIEDAEPAYSRERGFHQDRFFVFDPGGNRLEILEARRPYDSAEH